MKQSKILQVAQLGHKVIRQKAKPIKNIQDTKIQQLIDDLIATCKDFDGLGIAAPQVYESVQLFIIWSSPNERYPKAPKFGPEVVINPKILFQSKETSKEFEGCLSIPGIRAPIIRPRKIEVEYLDRKGKLKRKKFADFPAKIFLHEFDHLNGIVFLDHANPKEIITEKEYKVLMKKKKLV